MASPRKKRSRTLTVMVLSGGTGRTCEQVLSAALAQFKEPKIRIERCTNLRSIKAVKAAVESAREAGAVICHSIIQPKVRAALIAETERLQIPAVDILGPMVSMLADQLEQNPRQKAGLSYQLKKEQFDRIDAVDFTLAHDDGCAIHEIGLADVVLVGLSRVSKSVTCFYLACRGVRAANVPLLADHDPPQTLLELPPAKVIALTMNVSRLRSIREARVDVMGRGPFEAYVDQDEIERELKFANRLFGKQGWRRIDVSYRSVEEVASEVIRLMDRDASK